MSSPGTNAQPELPQYYPRTNKACKKVTEAMLACMYKNGSKEDGEDTQAGVRMVQSCMAELATYKKCMDQQVAKGNA